MPSPSFVPENLTQKILMGLLVSFIVGNIGYYFVEFKNQVKEKEQLNPQLELCNDPEHYKVQKAFSGICHDARLRYDKMNPWIDAGSIVIKHNFESAFTVVAFILNSWPVTIIVFTVCAVFLYNFIKKLDKSRKDSRSRRLQILHEDEINRIREENLIKQNTHFVTIESAAAEEDHCNPIQQRRTTNHSSSVSYLPFTK